MLKRDYFPGTGRIGSNLPRILWIAVISLLLSTGLGAFQVPAAACAQLWVLDNVDPDYTTPPFDDTLKAFLPDGTKVLERGNLNICQMGGGQRLIAVNPDGLSCWVAQTGYYPGGTLTKIAIDGTEPLSITDARYGAADVGLKSGNVYALISGPFGGPGPGIKVFTQEGNLLRSNLLVGGVDLVVDETNDSVWIVGDEITRVGLDLSVKTGFPVSPAWAAFSVDYASDGTAWVAEREYLPGTGLNRLLHIGLDGAILDIVPFIFAPYCVRVDRATGSIWVAGSAGLYKYTPSNATLTLIDGSAVGWSVALDYGSGLIWFGSYSGTIKSFSTSGVLQTQIPGFSIDQKWVATPRTDVLFSADFENDIVGQPPNSSNAVGTIEIVSGTSPNSIIVQGPTAGFTTKSLLIQKAAYPADSPIFRALPVGVTGPPYTTPYVSGTYTVTWKVSRVGGSQYVSIAAPFDFNTPGGEPFVVNHSPSGRIFYQDKYSSYNDTGVSFTNNVPKTFHSVVNLDTKRFDLYIDGVKVADQGEFLYPVTALGEFIFEIGGTADETYAIDDIKIFLGAVVPSGPPPDPCAGHGGDSDGDGICDDVDNCPTVYNPTQVIPVWYRDVDNDGYSDGTTLTQCLRPTGYKLASELIATTGDCNDNNFLINPGAAEVCDGVDNNCNGSIDEGLTFITYYQDSDGDSYGNPTAFITACSQPVGYVTNNLDCNDNDSSVNPGAIEIPNNGKDDDCNPATPDVITYTLTVTKSGTGGGTVTSSLSGIDCGDDCSEVYTYGTSVTLSAMPDSGSTFTGWLGGGCSGTGSCLVTMDADKSVTTAFDLILETISTPTTPSGPNSGTTATSYSYTTGGAVSNLGHDVQYLFDWGNGTDSGWLPLGITTASTYWTTPGNYEVKVLARCAVHPGVVSAWSAGLPVLISSTAGLRLYDDFSNPHIDKNKWLQGDFVREIDPVNQKLVLKVASPNPVVVSTFPYVLNNPLAFVSKNSINSIQADVTLAESIVANPARTGPQSGPRLGGSWYSSVGGGTPGDATGDIYAEITLRPSSLTPSGLVAHWVVIKHTNPEGTDWDVLNAGEFTTSVYIGTSYTYTLYVGYDRANNRFVFKIGSEEITVDGLPPRLGEYPNAPKKSVSIEVRLDNGTQSEYMSATFDNVLKNGAPYDDFSSPAIDPTKWSPYYEYVREISEGELRSKIRTGPSSSASIPNTLYFADPSSINVIEAKVTPLDIQNYPFPTGGSPMARIAGYFYHDGSVNVGAAVNIVRGEPPDNKVFAYWVVFSELNPGIQSHVFSTPIILGNTYALFLGWDGTKFTFRVNDELGGTYVPTTAINPPTILWKEISTRAWNPLGNVGIVEALFDDIMTNEFYTLTVTKAGSGTGTVTSSPAGINCGSDCSETYASGTLVTLDATPAGGSFFAGWSGGGCSGTGSCLVTMDAAKSVTATFTIIVSPPPTIISNTPNYGFVGTVDNFYMINGTGFLPGAIVKLTKSGESDIIATIDVITSTQIRGRISLLGAAEGLWNVVITNPDSQSATLPNGFTVNPYGGCPTPDTPLTPSPGDGATNRPTNQTLSWASSANADSYDVYFGASNIPPNPPFVGNVSAITGTSYSPSGMNSNTTYYWKIVAKNTCFNSTAGPLWRFTTVAAAPLPPILSSPGKGDTGVPLSPKLIWNSSNGANTYHLQVSTDPNFLTTTVDEPALTSTSYTVTGPLPIETVYYWRVSATKDGIDNGTSGWSEVWNFKTQPNYVPPFAGLKGITDPPGDEDADGIDDALETNYLHSSTSMKTLFVRPKKDTTGLGNYVYWDGFISLFPDSRPGFADVPAFTNAGIEIVVIGNEDINFPYEPMRHFNYDPSTDPNHPNCDILEIIYVDATALVPYCAACTTVNQGHTYFYAGGSQWVWDTKGFTPSASGPYGYKTPQIYPFARDKYFEEGAYLSIAKDQTPDILNCKSSPAQCTQKSSPLNVNGSNPGSGLPDATVEFNLIAFDSNGQILGITAPLPSTGYDKDTVLRRTTAHELGHALLAGLDSDHCDNPQCIMYRYTVDWVMHDFGTNNNCEHKSGGLNDIRAKIHNSPHGAQIQTFTISGTVTSGGSGLAGVMMSGLGSTPPTTDANGNYSGTVPSGWSGTVTPQKTGYTFTPSSRTYSNVTANQTGQNYTATLTPAPTITSITPNSGITGTSINITNLAGTGFLTGATVKLTRSGQTDINGTSVSLVSSTRITCTFNLTGAATGPWNVVVTNTDGQSATLTNGFTIANPAPTISGITPSSGNRGATVNITNLAGTGFLTAATVRLTRSGQTAISGTNVTVVSSAKITCTFNLPTGAATGRWNVVVTNTDGKSATLTNGFTIR